jgi:hypothetical protein
VYVVYHLFAGLMNIKAFVFNDTTV